MVQVRVFYSRERNKEENLIITEKSMDTYIESWNR